MNIDLHTHSNMSDGSLSPDALVLRAQQQGVEVLSITDHDTLGAYSALKKTSVRLIPGVEFSTVWQGIGIHIVGLNVLPESQAMTEATSFQTDARRVRARSIADRLVTLGAPDSISRLVADTPPNVSIGRPHFAAHLVESGFVRNLRSAYKKYLGAGKPGDLNTLWSQPAQIIQWIHEAEGLAVLAHPTKYKLTMTKLKRLLQEFKELGGDAMEVISGRQDQQTIDSMAELSKRYHLPASVGSDFHTPGQNWNELGNFPALPRLCEAVWQKFDLSLRV